MPTYLGFLRAVNVGKRQYKTADLRATLVAAGFGDVDTYIQTGNVRFTSTLRSHQKVELELERAFLADRGFEVPTVVFTPHELAALVEDADRVAEAGRTEFGWTGGHYINLLKRPIQSELVDELAGLLGDNIQMTTKGRAMHLLYSIPFGTAPRTPARAEKIIGVATNRSAKVIREIAARWC